MISVQETVLRLVVAAVLGGLVGLERKRLEWAAGMRTHALVSLGSALFMVVSIFGFSDILAEQHVILDPSRVAAQVASGIGFIGAGTIILRRVVVGRGTPLAELRDEIEAAEVPLERIVVRPGSDAEEDDAELVLGKGSRKEELLSLMDALRRVSGVREVNSVLMNGSAESKPKQ